MEEHTWSETTCFFKGSGDACSSFALHKGSGSIWYSALEGEFHQALMIGAHLRYPNNCLSSFCLISHILLLVHFKGVAYLVAIYFLVKITKSPQVSWLLWVSFCLLVFWFK